MTKRNRSSTSFFKRFEGVISIDSDLKAIEISVDLPFSGESVVVPGLDRGSKSAIVLDTIHRVPPVVFNTCRLFSTFADQFTS